MLSDTKKGGVRVVVVVGGASRQIGTNVWELLKFLKVEYKRVVRKKKKPTGEPKLCPTSCANVMWETLGGTWEA